MTAAPTVSAGSEVDRDNPWPGLASFTEDLRGFFFGRERETEELVRLVRRNTLTVLFGQSGLGKSSLLQAGVFPLLREADFLPLYLRLDHDPSTPPLADQVKAAIVAAIKAAGADAPVPRPDESLWEYFHRKDIDIWSAKNRLLTPVLAFDQFEEIFTLGRTDETRRERGRAFLTELADLVENRPPAPLRAKFDSGELDTARYNFDKPSCQVILSLREDFLPDLEGLKNEMRSLMHNRMRVRRLTGTQALEIVTRPAPHLLADGVAGRVVEFVAGARGGSAERLEEMEVEPALLSVICRELNQRRRTLGQAQITADLVSGNRREILNDFYERSVADLPPAVREYVEDHLLTKSGFRDNVALETVLEAPGVTRTLVDTLVSRRLLRIEDRLGVQRVELTHDVLADVISASRDSRREREALDEAKRQLVVQKEREAATRRSLVRARLVASVAIVLMLLAAGSAVFGFINLRRARTAETSALGAQADAQRTRQLAESARHDAEQLLNYLLSEFQAKLQETGQIGLFEQLVRRTVDYYTHLPPELVTDSTERNRAIALALLGAVLNVQNQTDAAATPINDALGILRRRVAAGDRSVDTAKGLALALSVRAGLYSNQSLPLQELRTMQEAVAVLRPVAGDPKADAKLKLEFARYLMGLGWAQNANLDEAAAGGGFVEAAENLVAIGGDDPKNEDAAATYAIVLKGLSFGASARGDNARAKELIEQAIALGTAILKQSPSRLPVLAERAGAYNTLAGCLDVAGKIREGLAAANQAEQDYDAYLRLNPGDGRNRQWSLGNQIYVSVFLQQLGRLGDRRAKLRESLAAAQGHEISSALADQLAYNAYYLAVSCADVGDRAGAESAGAEVERYASRSLKDTPAEHFANQLVAEQVNLMKLEVALGLGATPAAVHDGASATLARFQQIKPGDTYALRYQQYLLRYNYWLMAETALDLGLFAEAETSAKEAANYARALAGTSVYLGNQLGREAAVTEGIRAEAIAGQGRRSEARAIVDPLVAAARALAKASPEDATKMQNLTELLLNQAAAQEPDARAQRRAQLDEAQMLLGGLPEEVRQTTSARRIAARLAAAQAKF